MRIGKLYIGEDPEEDNEYLKNSWVYQDYMKIVIAKKEIDRIGDLPIYKYYDIFDLLGGIIIAAVILMIVLMIIIGR